MTTEPWIFRMDLILGWRINLGMTKRQKRGEVRQFPFLGIEMQRGSVFSIRPALKSLRTQNGQLEFWVHGARCPSSSRTLHNDPYPLLDGTVPANWGRAITGRGPRNDIWDLKYNRFPPEGDWWNISCKQEMARHQGTQKYQNTLKPMHQRLVLQIIETWQCPEHGSDLLCVKKTQMLLKQRKWGCSGWCHRTVYRDVFVIPINAAMTVS